MTTWLVCKACGEREWLQPHTPIVHCAKCGAPRYAEDNEGNPQVLFSADFLSDSWGPTLPDTATKE